MCNKLFQTYACGHSKTICTTACPHALKTAPPSQELSTTQNNTVSRSNSTSSSIAATTQEHSATNFSRPQKHSSLRASTNTLSAPTSPKHVPAFRFVAPSAPSPTSPVSPVSSSQTRSHTPAPPPLPPRGHSPDPSSPALNKEPVFCAYYIPRYLFTSKYPCLECYVKPEWEGLRKAWMENYRLGHPLDKGEEVEKLGGV